MCPKQIGGSALRAEVGRTDARNGHHLRTHVDGTDARRAEQTPFISQDVDLLGFWIRTPNALSRVSSVKCCHLRNPGRLAWNDRTPVGCGVQPKRLVKVREGGRLAKATRPHPRRNHETSSSAARHFHANKKPTAFLCHGPIAMIAAMRNAREFGAALIAGDTTSASELDKDWHHSSKEKSHVKKTSPKGRYCSFEL